MTLSSNIRGNVQTRTYDRADSVVFLKTKEAFGGLSNMAGGFPLKVNGIRILTSEALYQVCRFPHLPEVQKLIIAQKSPMTAKMKGKPHRANSRPDWDQVRVKIMRWCLRVKLAQHWDAFSRLLLETGNRSIVEQSRKDDFWGAKPVGEQTLVGMNVLGRLLMELRQEVKSSDLPSLLRVESPGVFNFRLYGQQIQIVEADGISDGPKAAKRLELTAPLSAPQAKPVQALLFDQPLPYAKTGPWRKTVEQTGGSMDDPKPYPAMKDSGVEWLGDVPEPWEVLRGKWLFRNKKEINAEGQHTNVLSLTLRGVVNNDPDNPEGLIPKDYATYQFFRKGDLVFKLIDLENLRTSRVGLVHQNGVMSPAYIRLLPIHAGVQRFFFHQYYDLYQRGVFNQLGEGVRATLGPKDLLELPIVVPEQSEQGAIVRFLDYIDRRVQRYILAKQKLIGLLEEQKQAIIHRAVTRGLDPDVPLKPSGIEWLGDVPEPWEVLRLGRVAKVFNGSTPSRMEPAYWLGGKVPWLSSGKVNEHLVESASELVTERALRECSISLVPKGAVIIGLVGQGKTRGRSAILGIDACISQNIAAIILLRKLNGNYLQHFLTAFYKMIREYGRGGNQEALNCEIVANIKVSIPPLDEQDSICDYLQSALAGLERAAQYINRETELLREYRTRLIADVVTGKVDVREAAANLPEEPDEPEPLDEADDLMDDGDAMAGDLEEIPEEAEA